MRALVALTALALGLGAARPAAPAVSGPRDTTLERPVYTFRARGAIGFRCSFDSTVLHRCARRYSERLDPGEHLLRVRSVGRRGALSRVVAVRVRVRLPVPELIVDYSVQVGAGAGVPAPDISGVWTPVTSNGTLVRVRMQDGAIVSRTAVGTPSGSTGALDSAVGDGRPSTERDIWSASDEGARIARVDPGDGRVLASFDVAPRPGGLAYTNRAVWAFHFLQGTVTRIELPSMTLSRLDVPGAHATGIAWGEASLWLLTTRPAQVLQVDPETGALRRTIDLRPPFPLRRSLIDTWSLTFAGDAVWATLPNHGAVARVDSITGDVRYIRIPYGNPFGIAVGAGGLWVATDRAVLLLNRSTGSLQAAVLVPSASRTGFVSIATGYGATWLTNYDRGTLMRLRAPGTPP
jgi:streptogramin lyase